MRKYWLLGCFCFLAACAKVEMDAPMAIDASTLQFNISINRSDIPYSKAVKAGWEAGDAIYVFFEDNLTNYLVIRFNGSAWKFSDREGGSSYDGLVLSYEGKHVSAVYLPYNVDAPVCRDGAWYFDRRYSYFMVAESVPYSVSRGRLSADLDLKAPEGFVQFYIEDPSPVDGTYALIESHFSPATCGAITPGGPVAMDLLASGAEMPGVVASVDDDKGYYFYGILDEEVRNKATQYHFHLHTFNPRSGEKLDTQCKVVTGGVLYTLVGGMVFNSAVRFELDNGWTEPVSAL